MAHSSAWDSIILRTVDIGEADRFCLLFTREGGRKAARAKGVRRPWSRMGGLILPFRRVQLQMVESGNQMLITGATEVAGRQSESGDATQFLHLAQGVELLLLLTEEDEPLPEVFDLLDQFLRVCTMPGSNPVAAFQLRLLHLLGLLPATDEDARFQRLSQLSQAFVLQCTRTQDLQILRQAPADSEEIRRFLGWMFHEQLSRPLKAMEVQF